LEKEEGTVYIQKYPVCAMRKAGDFYTRRGNPPHNTDCRGRDGQRGQFNGFVQVMPSADAPIAKKRKGK
jgi:hypothetical protein